MRLRSRLDYSHSRIAGMQSSESAQRGVPSLAGPRYCGYECNSSAFSDPHHAGKAEAVLRSITPLRLRCDCSHSRRAGVQFSRQRVGVFERHFIRISAPESSRHFHHSNSVHNHEQHAIFDLARLVSIYHAEYRKEGAPLSASVRSRSALPMITIAWLSCRRASSNCSYLHFDAYFTRPND